MLQSKLFPNKTLRQVPKEAESISHKLLTKAGFIDQLASGIWTFLPLGWRVHRKIENIIREEMNKISGEEVFMPTMQPKDLWDSSGRWQTMDPPLFKFQDRHKKWFCLGPTHEEVMGYLARKYIKSYKDLPCYLYQIQNKFRNELRATGGLLRTREFIMKDLYSFHQSEEDLNEYYKQVIKAYHQIYSRCELQVVVVKASSGAIGGKESDEFMVLAESGEDKIVICKNCDFAANAELVKGKKCPQCKKELKKKNTIEAGHVFKLGTEYSKKMNVNFQDKDGRQKPIVMGCYGIGLGRLLATIVEVHHDENGIIWPKEVAPFKVHLLDLSVNKKGKIKALKVYNTCQKSEIEVLYDDRDLSPGIKLKDADLIGIPLRLVVSDKTGEKVEWKERDKKEVRLLSIIELIKKLK